MTPREIELLAAARFFSKGFWNARVEPSPSERRTARQRLGKAVAAYDAPDATIAPPPGPLQVQGHRFAGEGPTVVLLGGVNHAPVLHATDTLGRAEDLASLVAALLDHIAISFERLSTEDRSLELASYLAERKS